jgi:hypothetical protein
MDSKSRWKYILLAIYAFVVVVVGAYLLASAYFHVPLISLLPFSPATKNISPVSPAPQGTLPPAGKFTTTNSAARRLTMTNGVPLYIITGKFVTTPAYNTQNLLQGDFVIDGDPGSHRISVIMGSKTDKISVVLSQGSFDSIQNVEESEDTERLRQRITAGTPAQLRMYPATSVNDIPGHQVLDEVVVNNWSIPGDFVLRPQIVGLLQ